MSLSTISDALDALRAGRPVIVADDENRENEGDVVLSAELATPEWIAWTVRWSSGFICAPMPAEWADRLDLPPMVEVNEDARGTAYTVSVDAADRVSTGISASDRAHTLNVLADPASTPTSVIRPGHILPLRAVDGGVRERGGHTEAAVELMRLAGLKPVGAIAEVVAEDGSMMRLPGLIELGERDGVPVITIEQLIAHLDEHEPVAASAHAPHRRRVSLRAEANVPTSHGEFRFLAYKDRDHRHRSPRRRLGRSHRRRAARARALGVPDAVRRSTRSSASAARSWRPRSTRSSRTAASSSTCAVTKDAASGSSTSCAPTACRSAASTPSTPTSRSACPPTRATTPRQPASSPTSASRRCACSRTTPTRSTQLRELGLEIVEQVPLLVGVGPNNHQYLSTKRDRMGHLIAEEDLTDALAQMHEGAGA